MGEREESCILDGGSLRLLCASAFVHNVYLWGHLWIMLSSGSGVCTDEIFAGGGISLNGLCFR